jgi:hypothetical protein
MKHQASNRDRDIGAVLECAEAYLRLAEPAVLRIMKLNESTEPHPFNRDMADGVAGATNLAFAIELYIKSILYVSKIDVPLRREGHNLGKLYAAMPEHFKVMIGKSYEETRKDNWFGRTPSITLSVGEMQAGIPKWDDNRSESWDIETLLVRSADVFTCWRYIFEFKKLEKGEWQFYPLQYGLLLSACRAMRDTIKEMRKDS